MAQQSEAEQQNQQQQPQQHQQSRSSHHPQADDDMEVIQMTTPRHDVYEKIYSLVEKFATTRIGLFVIERGDRALRVVEDTTKWSLPQQEDHAYYKLERPLPWIPFFALIITLRFARIWLSVAALMIGNGPVMPNNVIYFLQSRRRKLRALRAHGMKVRRQREIEAKDRISAQLQMGFLEKLTTLFSTAICRPGHYYEATMNVFVHHEEESHQQTPPQQRLMGPIQRAKRRRSDEGDDDIENLTCDQILSKYANEDSDDDSDFIPNADDYDGSSSSENNTSFGTTTDDTPEDNDGNMESESKSGKIDEGNAQNTNKSSSKTFNQSVEISNEHSTGHKLLMPKPMHDIKKEPLTDVESGNEPLTPKENGPSNGDEQRGEGDVVSQASNVTPSTTSGTSTSTHTPNFHLLNGNAGDREQQKSTPGHESAAESKPRLMLPLFGVTTATAIESNDQSINIDDISNDESNTPSSSPSSSSNTSSSSYSSLPSFMISDDDLNINESFSIHDDDDDDDEAQTPTPTSDNFDSSILSSASSSEDIFYSPIGSPPNFNATYKPVSILKKPTPKQPTPNQANAHHSTPKSDEGFATSDTVNPIDTSSKIRKHQHHQSQRPNYRYGSKNRH